MKSKLKRWLAQQEKRYAWRKKTFTQIEYPEYKVWLINEIKSSLKSIPAYHRECMRELVQLIERDTLWAEMLKKYLKEIK